LSSDHAGKRVELRYHGSRFP